MKNNFFKLLEYLYYFSLVMLFILYLFPGSLLGFFLYNDAGQQPNLVNNPIGTSINHFFFFIYLSTLSFVARLKNKMIINSLSFLFFISILLEFLHYVIPNRAFEYYDLFANCVGVATIFFFSKLISTKK